MLLLFLSGCAHRPTPAPIPTLELRREEAECLVVLLPGRRDRPADFRRAGFAEILAAAGVEADVVAVDAHLGYYRNETIRERLASDVIEPAQASGYEQIWLGGVSLGGLGSLGMAEAMPEAVDGVVVVAPFLGDEDLIAEMRQAGGARTWAGTPDAGASVFARLWRWLVDVTASGDGPEIVMAYGTRDGLAPAHRLLAELLPSEWIFAVPGGHDWRTWTELWEEVARRGLICRSDRGS